MIRKIQDNAEKIAQLLNELLSSVSKPSFDFEVERKEFYLNEWVDMVKANYEEELRLQHIEFKMEVCSNALIDSDPQALLSVAGNIIENAMKYGDGTWISMKVEIEESMLYVSIENSGTPILQSEKQSIFKSFYRGSQSGTKQGNGLGLYICKTMLRKLEGSIYVVPKEASNAFIFTVPIKW